MEPTAPNPDVGNLGMVNTKYHSNQYRQRMTSEREKETLQNGMLYERGCVPVS